MFIRTIRLQGKDITFIYHWFYEPTTSPQWRIQGRGPGARTPLFLGQSEARRAEKIRVWMTPPPPPYPKVWIRHCLVCKSNAHLVITWLYTVLRTTGTPIQCNSINRYGNPNATEENRMSARTFGDKNNNNKVASFDVIFGVYTHEDNRERARETNFIGRKTWKFHSGSEKMRNVSGQLKMSDSEKIKAKMNTGNKIFGKHMRQFLNKNNE